ncbi:MULTISPECIES: GntR family transcriptional regulator [unclassified Streptococcus]|uniref:GntR family transcriptional regulator n=1 Tax=unclassified Streptococcus TaxID=2608887 RepID=UPI00359ED377
MRLPKYQLIKNDLKKQITSGKFENGDRFYTEAELIKIYDVSSITVIRALNDLVKDGYLVRHQGKGTFVSRSRKGKAVAFSDIELFPIADDNVTVLSMTKGNDPEILEKLNLPKTKSYYKIVRVRKAKTEPYMYQESYIPEQYIAKPDAKKSHYVSIYQRFKLDFDLHLSEEPFIETNEICLSRPEKITKALALETGEPTVLQIRTTKRQDSQEVLEYIESHKHWKFYKFEISANKH